MVTVPVQTETNARMIITVTKKLEANAAIVTKRLVEIILDQLLVQEKVLLHRLSIAGREGKWESVLMEFVRPV